MSFLFLIERLFYGKPDTMTFNMNYYSILHSNVLRKFGWERLNYFMFKGQHNVTITSVASNLSLPCLLPASTWSQSRIISQILWESKIWISPTWISSHPSNHMHMGHTCAVSFKKQIANPLQAQSMCAVSKITVLFFLWGTEWGYLPLKLIFFFFLT